MRSVVYVLLVLVAVASAAPESRIVGGTPTTIEEFPSAVAFLYYYPGAGITVQRCVGSLVSSWHVLTSGFCYTGAILENMQIRAGSTSSLTGGTIVNVARFVKHPDYMEIPRVADIAVTFLDRPLGISSTINVLYLPPPQSSIPDGTPVQVVSWGFESETGAQLELLKSLFFNKMNIEQCQSIYSDKVDQVTVNDNLICGDAPGKSTCRGDSGAPMLMNNVILGVSSFHGTCDSDYPSLFVRVDRYTNWIMEVASAGRNGPQIRAAPAL